MTLRFFDYRGYGKSQGEPSPQGTVLDGKAALKWLAAKSPRAPVIVFGQSIGGAIALRSLVEVKKEVDVPLVVVESAFLSYQAAARSILSRHALTWVLQPLSYLLFSDQWAPDDKIAEIAPKPIIVIHAKEDPVIEFSLGREVFEQAQSPKEFWPQEGGGHGATFWRHRAVRAQLLKAMEKVLTR